MHCDFPRVEWNKRSFVAGSGFGLEGVCVYIWGGGGFGGVYHVAGPLTVVQNRT